MTLGCVAHFISICFLECLFRQLICIVYIWVYFISWDHQVFCIRERYLHITSDAQYSERATNGG